jgi:hypothetical protein
MYEWIILIIILFLLYNNYYKIENFGLPIQNLRERSSCYNTFKELNYYPNKLSSFIPLNEPQVRQYNRPGIVGTLRNLPFVNWTNDTYIPDNALESWRFNNTDLQRGNYPFGMEVLSPNSLK